MTKIRIAAFENDLQRAVTQIDRPHVSYAMADVSQAQEVAHYVQVADDHYGGIDVFFNNADIEGEVYPLTDYLEADFDRLWT